VTLYGLLTEIPLADLRRQFDVNYWGQVYGSRAAVRVMRGTGGALINIASVAADRAIPLQGNYSAAKHAVKAFSDSLRMELEAQGVPIAVTVIKPASIDRPFFDKARTYLGVEPPVYAPDVVARAILHAAEHPVRDVIVGGAGRMLRAAGLLPRTADRYMEVMLLDQQNTDRIPFKAPFRAAHLQVLCGQWEQSPAVLPPGVPQVGSARWRHQGAARGRGRRRRRIPNRWWWRSRRRFRRPFRSQDSRPGCARRTSASTTS